MAGPCQVHDAVLRPFMSHLLRCFDWDVYMARAGQDIGKLLSTSAESEDIAVGLLAPHRLHQAAQRAASQ